MTKTEAVQIFGSKKALAEAIGVHRSMISKLPEEFPTKYSDRTMGAAIRLGRVIPQQVAGHWLLVAGEWNKTMLGGASGFGDGLEAMKHQPAMAIQQPAL